jgi:predicted pyridoxine 5'-phosphate oxidase superfamily flavin-nucleotide-binding protein
MGSGAAENEMPPELVEWLSGGRLVVGATVDADGNPYTMVMNSALAVDPRTIRFALDHRTQTLVNIRANGRMMIEVISDGAIYGVRGTARVAVEQMQHAPIPSALIEVAVETVKRDLPPGVEVTAPSFRWGALEQYMSSVEPAMFEELRNHAG